MAMTQEPKLEVPTIYIYMAYIRPNFQGISPQFIWPNIWYVYVPPSVGFCFIPIDLINWHPLGSTSHYDKTAGMASGWFWTRANVGIHIPAPFCLHMGYRADLSFFFVPFMQQIYIYRANNQPSGEHMAITTRWIWVSTSGDTVYAGHLDHRSGSCPRVFQKIHRLGSPQRQFVVTCRLDRVL